MTEWIILYQIRGILLYYDLSQALYKIVFILDFITGRQATGQMLLEMMRMNFNPCIGKYVFTCKF